MSFIVTAIGEELDLHTPDALHITLASVAWSLAQQVRFFGHARRPYSIAEHSLLVAEIAERELQVDALGAFAALMHDAHESVVGDQASPAKAHIAGWHAWESRWERLVRIRFGLIVAGHVNAALVKHADLIALATERRDLMAPTPSAWPALHDIEPVAWVDLMSRERRAMSWEDWRDRFVDKFHELDYARQLSPFTPTRIV